MKTHSFLAHLVSTFVLVSTPACVISATDSDDDDGMGSSSGADSASGNSANDSDDPTDDAAEESSSGADESSGGNATAGGEGPEDGEWIYADDGASQNDCDFFEASQGVGDFSVENHGDGTFTITPGDATDAFDCQLGGDGAFECPERFVESVTEPGVDAALDVSVAIAGTTSATSMEGEQLGSMTCAGADCGLAEDLLGTSFPCAFVIPFTAAR
jgi:hypothetical protein